MAFIEYHEGCATKLAGCMGPSDPYYTAFGLPIAGFLLLVVMPVVLSTLLFFWLYLRHVRKQQEKRRSRVTLFIVMSIVTLVVLFIAGLYSYKAIFLDVVY